ncbi:TPR domain protein in aerotolerance operon [hydrothermal vent metagenome]|uniref:TPR domain protein in aerotolerance operon n=1 Tax=hydrothermal vent metagenome TaxID=652676 RepID=A0A1W1BUH8_9ZZZZ
MTLLNAWVLFGLIPVYFIYKKNRETSKQTKLLYFSLVFMFLAMARPAYENAYNEESFDSHDYIIALDASYSMQADDLKPSRYELAKQAIKKLLKEHPKDRFTLFAFTSSTLLISPPTTDTEISMMALEALNPNYILTKSTSLKNLFKRIATMQMKQKNLIIFSDGGDEHDIVALAKIAKKNAIVPYLVATATERGAALKKDGKYIKDASNSIVISKINPILVDLANATHGKYYQLKSLSDIDTLSNDLGSKQSRQERIKVKTYKELFILPLLIALALFFVSVTKFSQRLFTFISLLFFLPNSSHASLLDFHYLKEAKSAYTKQKYLDAAHNFEKLTPSQQSYYNTAVAYYKAGHYKKALEYFTQIKSANKALKQKLFYNIGNCAVKLKKYDRAQNYYIDALALGDDADALYNLNLIRKLRLVTQKDAAQMMPHNQSLSKKKKQNNSQQNNSAKKSGKQFANEKTNGAGSAKKGKQKLSLKQQNKKRKGKYKFSYKAYEKINKGYTDEKEPW